MSGSFIKSFKAYPLNALLLTWDSDFVFAPRLQRDERCILRHFNSRLKIKQLLSFITVIRYVADPGNKRVTLQSERSSPFCRLVETESARCLESHSGDLDFFLFSRFCIINIASISI